MTPGDEIVVDSNVFVNIALQTHPFHIEAQRLLANCTEIGVEMIAPYWFEIEADTALRHMIRAGLDGTTAMAAQLTLDQAPVLLVHEPSLRSVVRRIADQLHQAKLYDAVYVALAQLRGCEFWTADLRLVRNAHSVGLNFVHSLAELG